MRKKIFILLSALLLLTTAAYAQPIKITVSIEPQKYFVEKIGGKNVDVNVMVRKGASPANYEPQPKQMTKLTHSQIYFAIGVPFEKAWLPRFSSANENMMMIDLSKSVVKLPMKAHHHHEDMHHEHGHEQHAIKPHDHDDHEHDHFVADPHIWLSPALVRVLSMEIRDTLIQVDPSNKDLYEQNYISFANEINNLDSQLLKAFSKKQKQSFMVYHPSWGYFAKCYGLEQIPIELEGKDPSPKELAQLIDLAKHENVTTIFVQPQFSQKSAKAIADTINAKVLTADPLAYDWATNLKNCAKSFSEN